MAKKGLSRELALRIGLAARALTCEPKALLDFLSDLVELPLTRVKLEQVGPEQLKGIAAGAAAEGLEQAIQYLRGEAGVTPLFATPEAYSEGDIPDSIRVAVASNGGESANGHFASCQAFLVYQLSKDELRLIDVRFTDEAAEAEDKTAWLVEQIQDCQVLYVVSIGGPAAAKVIKGGIYPIKDASGAAGNLAAPELLSRLQGVLAGSPPPWLAKILGAAPEERIRFDMDVDAEAGVEA